MEAGDERRSEEAKKRVVIHAISTVAVLVIAVGLTAVDDARARAGKAAPGRFAAGARQNECVLKATFVRRRGRRDRVYVTRADGTSTGWDFPSYGDGLPHDLCHLVVEEELKLSGGFWGRMSRVPWNLGGGPVVIRRLLRHHRIAV